MVWVAPITAAVGSTYPFRSWRKSAPPGGRRWSYLSVSELEEVSAPWRSSVVVPVRLRAGGSQRPLAAADGPTCPSRSWRKSAPPGGRRWSYLSVSELEEVSAPWRSPVVLPVRLGAGGSQRPLAVVGGPTCPSRSWRKSAPPGGRRWSYLSVSELEEEEGGRVFPDDKEDRVHRLAARRDA